MLRADKAMELIGRFYDAALQPTLWSRAVHDLIDALGASAGGILTRTFSPSDRAEEIFTGLDPACEKAYLEHYFRHDPWAAAGVGRFEPGVCALSREVLPERELVQTEFYNDLCRPFGLH